jgi:hypothetical protein
MLTLALPPGGIGAALSALGTVAVSLSFLHSFWERYAPVRGSAAGDAEA